MDDSQLSDNSDVNEVVPALPLATSQSWPRNLRTSCDSCKQMKIKCERNADETCARCTARNLDCTTTPVIRKKRKLVNKDGAYFEDMEDRISRMESALITRAPHRTVQPVIEKDEEKSSSEAIKNQAELSNKFSNLVINAEGSSNFIGWASGFSLFSPQGLRWISKKISGEEELAELVRKMSTHDYGDWGRANADLWYPTPRSEHWPLPSKDLAVQYIDSYFRTFNSVLPVVNQKSFVSYFEQQYSAHPPTSIAWYSLLNIVLCLGSIRVKGEEDKHSNGSCLVDYTAPSHEVSANLFRNASYCFHDLFFKEANLMAMQAMTLMLFVTTSSPNPQPSYVITAAVGNIANTLGLHRKADVSDLDIEENDQRRNVFWVFFCMEKAISHNVGRPSVINDDDIAIDLPTRKPATVQFYGGAVQYDIFQDQIILAYIGSRIYHELYSASAQTRSDLDRKKALNKLDMHLQRWRDVIPLDIRPEHDIRCSDEQFVAVVMMHFIYLDAVILLHRISGGLDLSKDSEATNTYHHHEQARRNTDTNESRLLCLAAARRSIQLLDTFSNNKSQNQHLMWLGLYYPLSASLVLFANILSNPHDQCAASDLYLMSFVNSFIDISVQPGTSFAATPTLVMFKEIYGVVARLVAKSTPYMSEELQKTSTRAPSGKDLALPFESQIPIDGMINPSQVISITTQSNTKGSTMPHDRIEISTQETLNAQSDMQTSWRVQNLHSSMPQNGEQDSAIDAPTEVKNLVPADPNQLDYNQAHNFLLSPIDYEWAMDDSWLMGFESEPWASSDLMESYSEVDIT